MRKKILISNIGFGDASSQAIGVLENKALVIENKDRRRFTEEDFIKTIQDVEILIAGTEKITTSVLENAPCLKLIARVGVGVDNIDLDAAREKKISICYTPDAPSESVPEFTLALIFNLLKGIGESDRKMHQAKWHRPMGRMLSSCIVGIVGAGKIGSKVAQLIHSLSSSTTVLFYDPYVEAIPSAEKCDLEDLLKRSDVVSLHLSLNAGTKGLINEDLLSKMKQGSYLINTSRGSVIDEGALYTALQTKHLAGAALDVFNVEPYNGALTELDNCLLTSHIGSMTHEGRALMENQVAEDVVRYLDNQSLLRSLKGFDFAR